MLLHEHILLRPWRPEDAPWYVSARDDAVFAWTTESREVTVDETERAIEAIRARDDVFALAIADAHTQELLGNIALARDTARPDQWEVMYWLHAASRGRGAATTAVRLLSDWAFTHLGVARLVLRTHAENWPSQRVAERAGFERVDAQRTEMEPAESIWYVLTKAGHCSRIQEHA